MTIEGGGDVAIGTTNATAKFHVYNGSTTGRYTTSGWVHTSDRRLKRDIEPLESSLTKILELEPVEYIFKDDEKNTQQIGFIAQDVEPLFPEVVQTDDLGFKSMVYSNLVAPVVGAIQELYQQINTLLEITDENKRDIASLQKQVSSEIEEPIHLQFEKLQDANQALKLENKSQAKTIKAMEKRLKDIEDAISQSVDK